MNRLRKSFRDSFRRKKDRIPESSKPHQWEEDERAVRSGECSFPVKYLGCVEVFDSRGMHVCEEALKILRVSKRRPIKGVLYVTGDGLRVVDDDKRGLIVDQTIEKVSFCAPDRFHEKGFSYICRDGTTRRWMCHGFHAAKDSGERLSHAVGCAFAVCLEKKQKRDRDLAVSMQFDTKTSTFTRNGSFRQSTITERLTDPQVAKPAAPPPIKPVHNPYAIERPHATPHMLERQGSFRAFTGLSQASPFKRQLSLRLSELPSTLERQKTQSLCTTNNDSLQRFSANNKITPITSSPLSPSKVLPSSTAAITTSSATSAPLAAPLTTGTVSSSQSQFPKSDSISEMCKELSKGLQILSECEDPFPLSPSKERKAFHSLVTSPTTTLSPIKSPPSSTTPGPTPPPRPAISDACIRGRPPPPPTFPSRKPPPPPISQLRSQSLGAHDAFRVTWTTTATLTKPSVVASPSDALQAAKSSTRQRHAFIKTTSLDINLPFPPTSNDPFDTEWAASVISSPTKKETSSDAPATIRSTNPFANSGSLVKTFQVRL